MKLFTFFVEKLTKKKQIIKKCTILEKKTRFRIIQLDNGKKIKTHPEFIKRRTHIFPSVIFSEFETTPHIFHFKNRVLAARNPEILNEIEKTLIPEKRPYVFQSYTRELIDSINSNGRVLLVGHKGTGKTSIVEQIAARISQPVLRVNFNGNTTISDFLGHVGVASGKTYWVDGVLPKAMREGYWLITDEIDFADPAILSILHPVLENHGYLVLKENAGEIIKPHQNFRIFGTANSIGGDSYAYSGTQKMNDAFLDRWDSTFRIDYLPEKLERKVVRLHAPCLSETHIRKIVQSANSMRTNKNGVSLEAFSTRNCIAWAQKMQIYNNPLFCANLVFLQSLDIETRKAVELLIKTIWSDKDIKRNPR